ncbi:MAG: hypothetical protein BGO89_01010 [Candidatus Kapaibacterium thiocyanatum]|uniref:Uncharacterized protein n=1 Tax=Candidatus Kapaibacterium thiocyanatum TaxID=1895771 RepID=A0A1M3L6T8_9BACT|nr:MAG: hypothetical protein BGO89_01010 ['Candidatus Kapabacteria' thiocyanatum]
MRNPKECTMKQVMGVMAWFTAMGLTLVGCGDPIAARKATPRDIINKQVIVLYDDTPQLPIDAIVIHEADPLSFTTNSGPLIRLQGYFIDSTEKFVRLGALSAGNDPLAAVEGGDNGVSYNSFLTNRRVADSVNWTITGFGGHDYRFTMHPVPRISLNNPERMEPVARDVVLDYQGATGGKIIVVVYAVTVRTSDQNVSRSFTVTDAYITDDTGHIVVPQSTMQKAYDKRTEEIRVELTHTRLEYGDMGAKGRLGMYSKASGEIVIVKQ